MKGMSNNQIILSEAEKLAPATLHAIATAHHTAAQIEALAAQITVTEDDGTQHPGTTHDAEIMLAASELHTFDYWKKEGKSVKLHEKALIECYLWKYTTKPSKAQREAAEAERKAAAKAAAEQPASKPAPEIIPASVTDKKPGGWKKCSFYAICTTPQNPTNHAEKRDGYTDGVFNYYALHLGKATIWYAVHPAYGVSIGPGKNSRNAAKAAAFELLESVAKMEKTPSERLKNCAAMVAAAQNA